jgi:hypothetical protein
MTEPTIEFRWIVPEGDRLRAVRELEAGGGTVESSGEPYQAGEDDVVDASQSHFEPLIVIVSLMGVASLLSKLERLWRDFRSKGGWVVDLRDGKVKLRSLPNTPREELVIVTDQGMTTHRCDSGPTVRELIQDALDKTSG